MEQLKGPLTYAAVCTPLFAFVAAFVTWLRTWDERLNVAGYIHQWCLIFGILLLCTVITAMFGSGRSKALALGLVGSALLAVVWFWSLPILITLGLVHIYPIASVNP